MAKKQNNNFSSALLYMVLGALLVLFNEEMLGWAMTFAGVFFIVIGILDVLRYRLVNGIFNIAIGVIITVVGWTLVKIVLLVLGIFIAAKGLISLLNILNRPKKNVFGVIFASLTIALGIALAFGGLITKIITIVGVFFILDGILGLISALNNLRTKR